MGPQGPAGAIGRPGQEVSCLLVDNIQHYFCMLKCDKDFPTDAL